MSLWPLIRRLASHVVRTWNVKFTCYTRPKTFSAQMRPATFHCYARPKTFKAGRHHV